MNDSSRRNEFASGGARVFWSCPSTLFRSTNTISRFGERFRDAYGQYSSVRFLFAVLLLMVTACPSICECGARARAPCPMESVPLGLLTRYAPADENVAIRRADVQLTDPVIIQSCEESVDLRRTDGRTDGSGQDGRRV